MKLQLSLLLTGGDENIKILDECGLEISVPSKTGFILLIQTKLKVEKQLLSLSLTCPKQRSVYGKGHNETPIHSDALREDCEISEYTSSV